MCVCLRACVFIVEAAFGDISAFVFAHEKEPLYTPVEREERRHTLVELKEAAKAHWASVHLSVCPLIFSKACVRARNQQLFFLFF